MCSHAGRTNESRVRVTEHEGTHEPRLLSVKVTTVTTNVAVLISAAHVQLDGTKFPWALSVAPTEPVLGPTRRLIPPVRHGMVALMRAAATQQLDMQQ